VLKVSLTLALIKIEAIHKTSHSLLIYDVFK